MYMQKKNAVTALQDFIAAADAYNFHGDILKTYETGCELQKKRVECAIMIKAAMAEQED